MRYAAKLFQAKKNVVKAVRLRLEKVTAAEPPKTGPLIAVDIGQHDWSALAMRDASLGEG